MTKLSALAFFLFFCLISRAQDDEAKAKWNPTVIKIDGDAQEWEQPLKYYDASTKLFFAFANDRKNLYLCFVTNDEQNQVKIMKAGMKIFLSSKGKNKIKASISFPIIEKNNEQETGAEKTPGQRSGIQSMHSNFVAQHTMMEVKGFRTKEGMIAINDASGLNLACNWDNANKMVYEVQIPIKELFADDFNFQDLAKDLNLEVEIYPIKRASGNSGGGNHNYSGGGGGGGRMGGGRGGGMHRDQENGNNQTPQEQNQGGDRSALFEKSVLKQKFLLAIPPATSLLYPLYKISRYS